MNNNQTYTRSGILAVGLLFTASASAAPITGGISFIGNYTANSPDLTSATTINFGSVFTTDTTGVFLSEVGDGAPVTTPSSLSINPVALPGQPIWSVSDFSLMLTSLASVGSFNTPDVSSLTLFGTGSISGPSGFDPTPGNWLATFNRAGEGNDLTFSFSSSSAATPDANVADVGSALALLGMSLLGLHGFRRHLTRSR